MNSVYVTEKDYQRLHALVQAQRLTNAASAVEALCNGLKRAKVVASEEIPEDVVTMNSFLKLRNLKTDAIMAIKLVYPKEADVNSRKVSVLAPIGAAVLGCRKGDEVTWNGPQGKVEFLVEEVLYQPEAAGDIYL
ncbi:nucleoside diphosphate kinase regulator [Pontibacter beigongshangensis]|uniref:nucleoside diphosphate kinase regulator n=1 Tax=Pontibacter beigongshangensis TaxID=2574733 RepID=UPI0016509D48|nr:nucleoside diphosphate kinase regulator [Pontibacter beigongshangensis]